MDETTLKAIVEAVVFAAEEPVTLRQLAEVLGVESADVEPVVEALKAEYDSSERGIRLREVAGGLRFQTRPDYHPWIKILFKNQRSVRLSPQALQTLAIVAYKQPVTSPEVEEIRKVDAAGVLKNLLEKRLVKVLGRKEVVGRPLLYGTTKEFLLQFGLAKLSELPSLEEFAALVEADLGSGEPEEGCGSEGVEAGEAGDGASEDVACGESRDGEE